MGQANGKEKGDASLQSVDGGALVPQGVYSGAQDYDHAVVKTFIQSRKIAPFYKGLDDEESYAQAPYNTECPICFLYYPSPLNHTRCCGQPICSECFVQIKRADPNHTNPPSSEPAMCPYCQETDFGIVYRPPPPGVLSGEGRSAGVAESASAAREQAEGSAEGSLHHKKRKSFSASDPSVVTIDAIRPDWQAKLSAAEAAIMRRANRRIIMRQVGDRLIPIGVSSSRLGAELPAGSMTGPGGAIIIGENQRWGGERRGSRGRRGGDLAGFLHNLGGGGNAGSDMEEMMMMEAMRLSLLEHEEQQRRQAQAQSQEGQTISRNGDGDQAPALSAPAALDSSSILQQQQSSAAYSQPRSSSLAAEADAIAESGANAGTSPPVLAPNRSSANPQDLGISMSMMAELSELIEGGLQLPSDSVDSEQEASTAAPRRDASENLAQGLPTAVSAQQPSAPGEVTVNPVQFHSAPHSPAVTPPVIGSPSRIGSNPNNPFRRSNLSSANASPTHSRQGSSAQFTPSWNAN